MILRHTWSVLKGRLTDSTKTFFSTLFMVSCTLSMVFAFLLVGKNLKHLITLWGDELQMNVYLNPGLTLEEREAIAHEIKKQPGVGQLAFIDQQQAFAQFQKQLAGYTPELTSDSELSSFLSESFTVKASTDLIGTEQIEVFRRVSQNLKTFAGIEEFSFGEHWVGQYATLFRSIEGFGLSLIGFLLIGGIFIMRSAIARAIQDKRKEIEILELIGADRTFVRAPFWAEGACYGFFAGLFSLLICWSAFHFLVEQFATELNFLNLAASLHFFSTFELFVLLSTATLLGFISARFEVAGLNTGWLLAKGLNE